MDKNQIQDELFQEVAQWIALDCLTWAQARARFFAKYPHTSVRLDPERIETAIRETYAIFCPESHAKLLLKLRKTALSIMRELDGLDIYLSGAVLNGSANPESNIRLEIFHDDVKFIESFLMDRGLPIESIEPLSGPSPHPLESLGMLLPDGGSSMIGVRIDIYDTRSLRTNPYRTTADPWQQQWEANGRIDAKTLSEVLGESEK